ncbi:hypothetical protein HYX15_02690 [Candidatus Woesearchaeota archaeon]|nr:hypothetical protein [Candidatus Woesearchaeota archaeon]
MLDSNLTKKINDFVYVKPRTIQEIAHLIGKNWRTANSYIDKIEKEQGTISTRIFREKTKGALKIVFWNSIEKIHSSSFQERLFKQIESGRYKKDFSPLDIYHYVNNDKKSAFLLHEDQYKSIENFDNFSNLLRSAQSQVLFFSGNLSFTNMTNGKIKILDIIEEIAKKGINIKVLTRIEVPGLDNILNVLAINNRIGREAIEIRHAFQPLRTTIVDNKIVTLKEEKIPLVSDEYKEDELRESFSIIFNISDEEWVEWMQKVFWNLFRTAIPAQKRIEELETIKAIR